MTGRDELPARIGQLIRSMEHEVYLSSVSAWEIARKHAQGRLELPQPPEAFVPVGRLAARIQSLPLTEEESIMAEKLPFHHRDPFDRMLVAQALFHNMQLVSPDRVFEAYPVRLLW